MYKNLVKRNYFLIFIIFSGFPIFFIPNVWDATSFDYGFTINNLSGIETFYKEIGSPFQLIFIYIIFFLKNYKKYSIKIQEECSVIYCFTKK